MQVFEVILSALPVLVLFLFCPLMDLLGLRDQALQALDLLCAVEVREGWGVSVGGSIRKGGG